MGFDQRTAEFRYDSKEETLRLCPTATYKRVFLGKTKGGITWFSGTRATPNKITAICA